MTANAHQSVPTPRPTGFSYPYPWPPPPAEPTEWFPRVTQITHLVDDFHKTAAPWGYADFVNTHLEELTEMPAKVRRRTIAKALDRDDHEWTHKRNLGSVVHNILGEQELTTTTPLDHEPYVAAGHTFLKDWTTETIHMETSVYNTTEKYAGTPDRIVQLKNGATALIDWKTGKVQNRRNGRPYGSMELQLTFYGNAQHLNTGTEIIEMPPAPNHPTPRHRQLHRLARQRHTRHVASRP
jgi:RecB family exonuclease